MFRVEAQMIIVWGIIIAVVIVAVTVILALLFYLGCVIAREYPEGEER